MQKQEHHLLLTWLIFTGTVFFLFILAWQQNILYLLFSTDRSRISVAISLLYFCVTIHCIIRIFNISSQVNHSKKVEAMIINKKDLKFTIIKNKVKVNGVESIAMDENNLSLMAAENQIKISDNNYLPDCLITEYIHDLINKTDAEKNNPEIKNTGADHIEYYESKLKSPHEIGWFTADIMIKMGLLGTIVGFILMLGSVSNLQDFDVTTMQKILSYMSSGMGTALYTTLAGLICSMLAAIQYQMLDRSADDLIDSIRPSEWIIIIFGLIFTGTVFFLFILAWQQDILYLLFSTDRSRISAAISLLYFCITIHCIIRIFNISSQVNHSKKVEAMTINKKDLKFTIIKNKVKVNGVESIAMDENNLSLMAAENQIKISDDNYLPDCLITEYIHDLINKTDAEKNNPEIKNTGADHIEYYESKLKSPHEIGWFTADIMIKMGLLGTIVGFILMLGSVSNLQDFDVTTMQKILSYMSSGMGTALYTTLAGLICSMLAAIQYQMLDRSADDLIDSIRQLTRVYVLPRLS